MTESAGQGSEPAHLLGTRRFAPFFVTQFLGAFNDNLYKNALVVLLTFQAVSWTTLGPGLLANLAAGLFILPFFLFSATAGQLADKYDKARLARLTKLLEIVVMGVAALGFWWHSLSLLLLALFLMGLQSAIFGPVKYAILPQHLHADELIGGNAWVEAGTFVAILAGTLAGALLAGSSQATQWISAGSIAIAVLGYLASRAIPLAPAPVPELVVNLNPLTETCRNLRFARADREVFLALIGISWFWLYGALFLAQFPAYGREVLGGSESAVTLLLATFTVGIGFGSMLCERLSGRHLELGLVPLGAIGLTLFGLDFAWATSNFAPFSASTAVVGQPLAVLLGQPAVWRVIFDLLMLGGFGGLFIVPLYALMQICSPVEQRARIVAANNILNAAFMVTGALTAAAALSAGLSLAALFGLAAVGNGLVVLAIHRQSPTYWRAFQKRFHGKMTSL
jgi:hypothetical protein